jgi:hypothetical protein
MAFLFMAGLSFSQENQEPSPTDFQYAFEVEFVNEQADEGTIKDIKSYAKDLFEAHPTFSNGAFRVSVPFSVPADRVTQHLGLYGFTVTSIRIVKDGKVLTAENLEQ